MTETLSEQLDSSFLHQDGPGLVLGSQMTQRRQEKPQEVRGGKTSQALMGDRQRRGPTGLRRASGGGGCLSK